MTVPKDVRQKARMSAPGWLRPVPAGLLLCLGLSMSARAQTAEESGLVPNRAFFAGLGASYNAVNFGPQSLYAIGISDNYQDANLVSYGTAAGPGTVSLATPSTGSPAIDLGYFERFPDSPWLWGAKFIYSDLRASATTDDVNIPQSGSFTDTQSHAVVPFTGDAVVDSYETEVNSRFAFMPFIGRSFGRGFVYLGAGGTMSEVRTSLDGLVGYAVINGVNTNVSGAPQTFSSSGWVLGAGLVVGGTYFLGRGWFVDLDYSFAKTAAQIGRYESRFVNTGSTPGVTTVGTLVGQSSETIVTNSVTLTIDKAF